jgi:hypothetical protein
MKPKENCEYQRVIYVDNRDYDEDRRYDRIEGI